MALVPEIPPERAGPASLREDALPPKAAGLTEKEFRGPAVSDLQTRADGMISEHGFLGVPRETFAQAGREQLIALLADGLRPESRLLEFGCGCLRVAFWLIRFLD